MEKTSINIDENFATDLQLLWSIESGLVYTLPKLIEKAVDLNLVRALIHYFAEAQKHRTSIEAICRYLDIDPNGQRSEILESIIAEMITTFAACEHGADIDDLIITTTNEIGQHEIAEYQHAVDAAENLGLPSVHKRLLFSLNEYEQASRRLSFISENLDRAHTRPLEAMPA